MSMCVSMIVCVYLCPSLFPRTHRVLAVVGGGIGITPLISIYTDLHQRYSKGQNQPCAFVMDHLLFENLCISCYICPIAMTTTKAQWFFRAVSL